MRVDRLVGLALLLIALRCGWTPSRGADAASESLLKSRGLTKSGHAFVIEAETPVLAKMKELRVALDIYSAAAHRKARAEQDATQISQIEERRAELQSELEELNQQINLQGSQTQGGQPFNGFARPGGMNFQQTTFTTRLSNQRDQVKNYLAEIRFQEREIKSEAPQEK